MQLLLLLVTLGSARAVDLTIGNHWSGGFQAKACVPITAELHGWKVKVTFDQPLKSLDAYTADIAETLDGGKTYVLTNKVWNADEHAGDTLCLEMQGHITGDVSPTGKVEILGADAAVTSSPNQTTPDVATDGPTEPAAVDSPDVSTSHGGRLQVQGEHFVKDGKQVFLSGTNLAWINYARDFGNKQYANVKSKIETIFKELHEAGGNAIRLWVHIEGESSPKFDSSGMVTGLDNDGTFISDFKEMLDAAAKNDVLVFPTLWNAAVNQGTHNRLDGLIKDTHKLQSYLDNALTPLVKAIGTHHALGGWDIINEPEGEINPGLHDPDPCFDTQHLVNSGAGWAGKLYTFQEIDRFINWQAAAIKDADPEAIITVGDGIGIYTDELGQHDHYKDSCLIKAGGKKQGTLSFYQIHSYDWQGKFDPASPFLHSFSEYKTGKPMVIGEFRASQGAGRTIQQMYNWAYDHGYAGAWSWQANEGDKQGEVDSWRNQRVGIAVLKSKTNPTTHINV